MAARGTRNAADDYGGLGQGAYQSTVPCFLARREEVEAWVHLLHNAHLQQLRRPYGPLFYGKDLLPCASLRGCVADAEVHHTYLAALLRQRTEASAKGLCAHEV
ncbi:hypothetical protein JKF63_06382 [Porcisia hertigi]|uniref:Uncharacterized protein n=1 Tax=Porcisia hertigi TaxID=2761500 RepID=A0A836LJT9_9TRYP|nr:hypothetical protein JKF63_06382 [Porcisia hertigi]